MNSFRGEVQLVPFLNNQLQLYLIPPLSKKFPPVVIVNNNSVIHNCVLHQLLMAETERIASQNLPFKLTKILNSQHKIFQNQLIWNFNWKLLFFLAEVEWSWCYFWLSVDYFVVGEVSFDLLYGFCVQLELYLSHVQL